MSGGTLIALAADEIIMSKGLPDAGAGPRPSDPSILPASTRLFEYFLILPVEPPDLVVQNGGKADPHSVGRK